MYLVLLLIYAQLNSVLFDILIYYAFTEIVHST